MSSWLTVEHPGYFGRHRAERHQEYDIRFGLKWKLD